MKHFTLEQIAEACGGKYIGDESLKNTAVSSIERDSRNIKENSLFLALKARGLTATILSKNAMRAERYARFARKLPKTLPSPTYLWTIP